MNELYLGDGLFVSHDGFQICLRTGDGNNQRVFLDPEVLQNFLQYVEKIKGQGEVVR